MFLTLNKKSILLATAIAFSCYGIGQAQSKTQKVKINFEALVDDEEFKCGESYEKVGSSKSTVTPTDFRFYVSDVALIDEDGNVVPVELQQDGVWQYQNVALLDFENGKDDCDNGTSDTRTKVVGTVPEGDYESLQFTLGVPKKLNHEDAAIAPSPLNLTSMWWNWQGGYKFLRVDLEPDEAIANVAETSQSHTSHSQNGHSNVQINQQTTTNTSHQGHSQTTHQTSSQSSIFKNGQGTHHQTSSIQTSHQDGSNNSYLIHIGSTGCQDSAQSNLFDCANPNRAKIILENFDYDNNVVIADLAELLSQTDLTRNQADTPVGCMSSPEDSDCQEIIHSLGLPFNKTSSSRQTFFRVD